MNEVEAVEPERVVAAESSGGAVPPVIAAARCVYPRLSRRSLSLWLGVGGLWLVMTPLYCGVPLVVAIETETLGWLVTAPVWAQECVGFALFALALGSFASLTWAVTFRRGLLTLRFGLAASVSVAISSVYFGSRRAGSSRHRPSGQSGNRWQRAITRRRCLAMSLLQGKED